MPKYHIVADATHNTDEFPLLNKSIMRYISHEIIALDGAAGILKAMDIMPVVIIGDLDSINQETIDFFQENNVKVIKIDDQDSTDLDKGMEHALSLGATEIIISNALGGRADHTIYNYRIMKKYYSRLRNIKMVTLKDCMQYFEDAVVQIIDVADRPVSILSFPKAIVKSQGLQYELDNLELEMGLKESSSNKMIDGTAIIEIKGKALVIYPLEAQLKVVYNNQP
ncbi:MAG: thiamine diphosphokinase [Rickettsiales bacterium]